MTKHTSLGAQAAVLFIAVTMFARPAAPQALTGTLYLVAATPSGKLGSTTPFDAELYRIDSLGGQSLVRKVALASEGGVQSVVPDYESGVVAIIKPYLRPNSLEIISMADPGKTILRSITFSAIPESAWTAFTPSSLVASQLSKLKASPGGFPPTIVRRRILKRTGRGNWLALTLGKPGAFVHVGYPLSTEIASSSGEVIPLPEFATFRVAGEFGFMAPGLGDSELDVIHYKGGKWIARPSADGPELPLGAAPELGTGTSYWRVLAHDGEVTVIRPSIIAPDAQARARAGAGLRMFRRQTGRWEPLNVPGDYPAVRIVQGWLMIAAGNSMKGARDSSPGRENRRAVTTGKPVSRPPSQYLLGLDEVQRPGILVFLDTKTGRSVTIQTNQGDSEPLIADGDYLYYRVNDRILRSRVQGATAGPPEQLAKADELRDAHWAFFSR